MGLGAEWELGGGPSRKSDLILPTDIRTSQLCSSMHSPGETTSMGYGEMVPSGWGGAEGKEMGLGVLEIPPAHCQTQRDPKISVVASSLDHPTFPMLPALTKTQSLSPPSCAWGMMTPSTK